MKCQLNIYEAVELLEFYPEDHIAHRCPDIFRPVSGNIRLTLVPLLMPINTTGKRLSSPVWLVRPTSLGPCLPLKSIFQGWSGNFLPQRMNWDLAPIPQQIWNIENALRIGIIVLTCCPARGVAQIRRGRQILFGLSSNDLRWCTNWSGVRRIAW